MGTLLLLLFIAVVVFGISSGNPVTIIFIVMLYLGFQVGILSRGGWPLLGSCENSILVDCDILVE